jgi:hypothetical protein
MLKILYSCFNNYDLTIGENLAFIEKYKDQLIIIDDHSSTSEFSKGSEFFDKLGVPIHVNPGKGLQQAVDYCFTALCSPSDWLLVLQQDVRFIGDNQIELLEERVAKISRKKLKIGAIGFPNYVPNMHYHEDKEEGDIPKWYECWLGIFSLSDSKFYSPNTVVDSVFRVLSRIPRIEYIFSKIWHKVIFHRNFSPKITANYLGKVSEYEGLTSVELPVWTAVAISGSAWSDCVDADPTFIFHLWFPDVAMQLMNSNYHVCMDTTFIVYNDVLSKNNYGIEGSWIEGKKKNGVMEAYGQHHINWEKKWGFHYEDPFPNHQSNSKIASGSVLESMCKNDPNSPLLKFELD